MRNNLYDLFHEAVVRCNLAIPTVNGIFDNNGDDSIKLEINVVTARQRRKKLVQWTVFFCASMFLGTKYSPDESSSCFLGGERNYRQRSSRR